MVDYEWTDEDVEKVFGPGFVSPRERAKRVFNRKPVRRKYLKTKPGRYRVLIGSNSAHCCFAYTVMKGKQSLCECFFEEDAIRICDALNGKI